MVMIGFLVACGADASSTGVYDANANEITQLNVGFVLMDDNPEAGRANEEFRQALEDAIGIPIVEIEGISHLVGLEAMRSGSLDLMFASPFTYLTGLMNIDDLAVEFLVSMLNPDVAEGNTLFITAQENEHISTLADLEGESFAFVDTASLTGFLFPMYQLVSTLNTDHTQMLNPGYFFSTTILSGGHDASLMAAINGDVAAAAVVSTVIEHMSAAGVVSEDDFRIIYEMEPAPAAGYIVRADLPQTLIDDLRTFFLGYDDADFFYNVWGSENARFVATDPTDFEHLIGLMQSLEIGLSD